jgi:hypothetical protein
MIRCSWWPHSFICDCRSNEFLTAQLPRGEIETFGVTNLTYTKRCRLIFVEAFSGKSFSWRQYGVKFKHGKKIVNITHRNWHNIARVHSISKINLLPRVTDYYDRRQRTGVIQIWPAILKIVPVINRWHTLLYYHCYNTLSLLKFSI